METLRALGIACSLLFGSCLAVAAPAATEYTFEHLSLEGFKTYLPDGSLAVGQLSIMPAETLIL